MGIKQRRERERQEIHQSIPSAAQAIAAEEGWQAVTTRKVAEHLEHSQPTFYEYLEYKQAIFLALLHLVCKRMRKTVQQAAERTTNPEEQLLTISKVYWNFAFTSPELYQVMRAPQGVVFGQPDAPSEAKQTCAASERNGNSMHGLLSLPLLFEENQRSSRSARTHDEQSTSNQCTSQIRLALEVCLIFSSSVGFMFLSDRQHDHVPVFVLPSWACSLW